MLAGRTEVSVTADRELVVLKIGSQEMRMGYEEALKLSAWLRLRGKEAKRNAGDISRRWSVIADVGTIADS
jgi:hypothetical protein